MIYLEVSLQTQHTSYKWCKMLLIRDIDNCSLELTYTRVSTGCQCNYELTLKTCFWPKVKKGPYFSSYFKVSPILLFSCFLQEIKLIIIIIIIIITYWTFHMYFYLVFHLPVQDCSFGWNRWWWLLRDISSITWVNLPFCQSVRYLEIVSGFRFWICSSKEPKWLKRKISQAELRFLLSQLDFYLSPCVPHHFWLGICENIMGVLNIEVIKSQYLGEVSKKKE